MTQILELLDFEIKAIEEDMWHILVPTYRVDVTRDVDVAEELLRIYGFNEVPVPDQMRISVAVHDPRPEKIERSVLDQLTGNGFYEIMNNSLAKGTDYTALLPEGSASLIEMLTPLSLDLKAMQITLLFVAFQTISFKYNSHQPNLTFFDRVKTYGN